MEFTDRFRIFWIAFVISIWLLIIDAINPLANLDTDNLDAQEWTYYCLVISGLIMGIFGGICALMILCWVSPRCAGMTMAIAVLIAAILRVIAVTVGFNNFSGRGGFNTTTGFTTAFAILLLQIYIIWEGFQSGRKARRETMADVNA
mmetsp:Transcript_19015/g.30198  ORF Transcript_19015/g.30198 Transcript_19015/m.30198 type:complete len:147 (+) Transcript_19015:106-546(+)|eukprot:CAMPEP_0197032082 /NCGR_PEP_ID=MMETSP1384-20130603/10843_1 /TAXON_ID=29189 /ORGANISM="Ammonia sp." /LENGTH=146 /DNA_ID=CAMNT_0042461681 /DNA_START=84 /DNA_END=524 /DNA_ORIENTATION=-